MFEKKEIRNDDRGDDGNGWKQSNPGGKHSFSTDAPGAFSERSPKISNISNESMKFHCF